VISGARQLFVVKRAWRIAPFEGAAPAIPPDELVADVERISDAALCDVGADAACAATIAETLKPYTDVGDAIFQPTT